MMPDYRSAWDTFLLTGRVTDYLEYCDTRKKQMLREAKEAGHIHATDNNRHCSEGLQNRGG